MAWKIIVESMLDHLVSLRLALEKDMQYQYFLGGKDVRKKGNCIHIHRYQQTKVKHKQTMKK